MNKFVKEIALYVLEDTRMSGFAYRQQDKSLIKKEVAGFEKIELRSWVDQSQEKDSLVILPVYSKRFNVLHEWFESFSFKKLNDQRNQASIGFEGSMLDEKNEYRLFVDQDFNSEIDQLKENIVRISKKVFYQLNDLDSLYHNVITPVLEGNKCLPDVGADWAFRYLVLARLVGSSAYPELEKLILHQLEKMNAQGEPNVTYYYKNIENILSEIKQLKRSKK